MDRMYRGDEDRFEKTLSYTSSDKLIYPDIDVS